MNWDFTGLLSAIGSFFTALASWALDGILWLLKSVLFLVIDGFLTTVQALFTVLDISSFVASYALQWTSLPAQALYILNACGVPICITMLAAAITIRLLINLIPGVLTRV